MWRWMRRWRDWAMDDFWPTRQLRAGSRTIHIHAEKAGLTLTDGPIPWNAEAVLVETLLRLPSTARQKADFQLHLPDGTVIPAESLRPIGDSHYYRLYFRMPTPTATVVAQLRWRHRALAPVTIAVLSPEVYRQELHLDLPTVFVRLVEHCVAARTFVSRQCRGLHATAVLRHPHGLAALADLPLRVRFESRDNQLEDEVVIHLTSSQLASREALITAVPRTFPRRMSKWTVRWLLGEQELHAEPIQAISPKMFLDSLRLSDTRYLVHSCDGVHLRRQVPSLADAEKIGPCFLVSSREPGIAGLCELQVRAQVQGGLQSPLLMEQTLLVTDGPTLFAPGTLSTRELENVTAFELRLNGRVLGSLSLRPIPQACFNGEGAFKSPSDYAWSALAEEELHERLSRLMGS